MIETGGKSEKIIGCLAVMHSHLVENDFISSYIPFVATVLLEETKSDLKVNVDNIVERFTEMYGFEIFRAPMISILNKCVRKGIVIRSHYGNYVVRVEECKKVAITGEEVRAAGNQYKQIAVDLSNYYETEFGISEVSESIVEEKLLLFLSKYSAKTLTIRFEENEKAFIFKERELTNEDHFYIISQFVLYAKDNSNEAYRLIQNLAMAYLMSSCIAYTEERDDKAQIDAFKNLCIYVDTPWLLRIIGVSEDDIQAAEIDLLKRLKNLNAHFKIFRHTYDETMHILTDCLYWMENPEYDVTYASQALRFFINRKFSKEEVNEFIDTLDYKLKFYSIEIDETDYYSDKNNQVLIDEQKIVDTIVSAYDNNSSSKNKAKKGTIENDARSIAHVLRKWGTRRANTYRQACDVFVTTNETLAYASRKLPEGFNRNEINKVYPCITNIYLGTNIWLSAPVKTIEQFSIKKLIADCLTQIEPSEKLLTALREAIEKYSRTDESTSEKLFLLRTKAFSNDYLMNATLGDAERFSDVTTEELLESIEEEIRQPEKAENKRLIAELDEYKDKDKEIADIVKKSEEKAEKLFNRICNTTLIALIIAALSFLINMSGILKLSPGLITGCSIAILVFVIIEILLRSFGKRIKNTLVKIYMVKNGTVSKVMNSHIKT